MTNSFSRFDVGSIPVRLAASVFCAMAGVSAGLLGAPAFEHLGATAAAILAFTCAGKARAILEAQADFRSRVANLAARFQDGDFAARLGDGPEPDGPAASIDAALDAHARQSQGGAGTIEEACRRISEGDFEARITRIDDNSPFAAAAHAVNDAIDRCDAFVREATASMDAVCRGVYYRQILSVGMNGAFRLAAETINSSVRGYGQAVADARRAAEAEKAQVADAIAKGLARLADKDMTFRLGDELPEAYDRLKTDFNSAVDSLESAFGVVLEGAHSISSSTREVAAAADDLARRTEQQAAAIEETSAAISEISTTVAETAEGARKANAAVDVARNDAESSGPVVRSAMEAMSRVGASSRNIAKIVDLIDEIAFQTNLLALNAAVEAARAGEAGRGFSVVAAEVRILAGRAAQSAKEIASFVATANEDVAQGARLVSDTGTALERIAQQIAGVSDVVKEIAGRTSAQCTAIQEVTVAVGQMDEDTQKNAAMVEETSAATRSLQSETETLAAAVGEFKTGARREDEPRSDRRAA